MLRGNPGKRPLPTNEPTPEALPATVDPPPWLDKVAREEWRRLAPLLADNPHMTFSDGRYRGYARFDLSRERLGADLRAMESVQKRESGCNTLASFVVEDGKPGAVKNSA